MTCQASAQGRPDQREIRAFSLAGAGFRAGEGGAHPFANPGDECMCFFFSDYIIGKQFSWFCDPSNLAKCFGHLLYIKQLGHHSVD